MKADKPKKKKEPTCKSCGQTCDFGEISKDSPYCYICTELESTGGGLTSLYHN